MALIKVDKISQREGGSSSRLPNRSKGVEFQNGEVVVDTWIYGQDH